MDKIFEFGKLIVCGIEDDKGVIVIVLYVMKVIKDNGIILNNCIELMVYFVEEFDWVLFEEFMKIY